MSTDKNSRKSNPSVDDKWITLLEPTPELPERRKSVRADTGQLSLEAQITATETVKVKKNKAAVSVEKQVDISADVQDSAKDNASEKQSDEPSVYTISEINGLLKGMIEKQFSVVWLRGEISNFTAHSSGHYYFSLKDSKSQIKANMFKGYNSKLKFRPEAGMEVIVRGRLSVYEPRGDYSITCETMEPVGAGALQKAFEQLKDKLRLEGLFAQEHKQKLPALPKHIGIVTSPTGAAIQDILNVLSRRYKNGQITLIPARVQGEGAAREVVRGIEMANRLSTFDVLIVGRGGGSIEDLWCFNEEIVARAIFASKIPIISAVGHEIDFTIADFVADVRAPTPSAAAELVAQSAGEITERIANLSRRLKKSMQLVMERKATSLIGLQKQMIDPKRKLEDLIQRCDDLTERLSHAWSRYRRDRQTQIQILKGRLPSPRHAIATRKTQVETLTENLQQRIRLQLERSKTKTNQAVAMLDSLSPLKVLSRGYSISFYNSTSIKSIADVQVGQEITTLVGDGEIVSQIKELKKN